MQTVYNTFTTKKSINPVKSLYNFNLSLKINKSAAPCAVDMKTLKKLSTARVLRHL